MDVNIPDKALTDIIKIAKIHGLKEVILFGSRARGDHRERSDVDLAIRGGSSIDYRQDLNDFARSFLHFDVVSLDTTRSDELRAEVARDGVKIYEKAG